MADEIVDTSDLTVHELRQLFHGMVAGPQPARSDWSLTFESFGFKHGVPLDADLVFDCRFLRTRISSPACERRPGEDKAVATYMQRYPETREFMQRLSGFLRYVVPHYVEEGKAYLTVAIGCTGGRHRSVYLAEMLKKELARLENVRRVCGIASSFFSVSARYTDRWRPPVQPIATVRYALPSDT